MEYLTLRGLTYGDPKPDVTAMVAAFGVDIFTAWEGFDR